ncbi:hypothetical protein RFEPED_1300 [Rickettsia felis str. Pedreira]|uniref:Uncharacterized protein n=1 Tax=Rickettsia felis str. Pedreira TaxID=1359196 RepID=A0A0F3MT34_RICFI|nr:hypothetical protein RFEPED_1300 [Rickettsia felis str. Pedreira]
MLKISIFTGLPHGLRPLAMTGVGIHATTPVPAYNDRSNQSSISKYLQKMYRY